MHSFDAATDLSAEPTLLRGMTPEQKDRLSDLLDRYLASLESGVPVDPEELKRGNPDLAAALTVYLQNLDQLHDAAAGFAGGEDEPARDAEAAVPEEKRIGDFKLVREVGRGGMGVVYEAWQISLARRVALKILPFAAVLDSKQIARFKNEAQAAAQLHHPNIVPVFAVGVERGVHYYAMQFIDGQPLDEAIDQLRRERSPKSVEPGEQSTIDAPGPNFDRTGKATAITQRKPAATSKSAPSLGEAALVDTVCRRSTMPSLLRQGSQGIGDVVKTAIRLAIDTAEALHAAHEYGIVHRDVKPSNLLLDGDGKVWITDFGLARCHQNGSLTKTGDVVGTLRYMSPEQAAGNSALVDQRTDVYSLGATLYELVALRAAFPDVDGAPLLRRIEQEEPTPLRQLAPRIPVDLETVVAKAMAKQPAERYATARLFADDLRRVLAGQPTLAKPPTVLERVTKWTRRHSHYVAVAALVGLLGVVGLTSGMFVIAREKAKADASAKIAKANFHQAHDTVNRFGGWVAEHLKKIPSASLARKQILEEMLVYYTEFAKGAADDPGLAFDLATTYSKIGTITEEFGKLDDAVAAHETACELFGKLVDENPNELDYRRRLAVAHNNRGLVLLRAKRTEDARAAYLTAIELQRGLLKTDADNEQYNNDLVLSYTNLGMLQQEQKDDEGARESLLEAIRLIRRRAESSTDDADALAGLAAAFNNLTALYHDKPERAIELHRQALDARMRAAKLNPNRPRVQADLAVTYCNLGAALAGNKDYDEACKMYANAIAIQQDLAKAAPQDRTPRIELAVSYNNLGMAQNVYGKRSEAEGSFREALAIQEGLVAQFKNEIELRSKLGNIYNNLGMVLEGLKRKDEAATAYGKGAAFQRAVYQSAPRNERYRSYLNTNEANYGRVLRDLGRVDEAIQVAVERRELWTGEPDRLLDVAEELAHARRALERGDATHKTSVKSCSKEVIETLGRAVAAGWKPPRDFGKRGVFADFAHDAQFAALVKP